MEQTINGISLAFDDMGAGPAVLLIHGFPLGRQMWRPQVESLVAAGYRCITPDLRGFGGSEPGSKAVTMKTYADDCIALLDHLGVEKAVVCGMSMGGYVLLNLMERYPERLAAACLIVTRSNADDEATRDRRSAMADEAAQGSVQIISDIFKAILFTEQTMRNRIDLVKLVGEWMQQHSPLGLAAALRAMRDRKDYTPLLPKFRIPVLVIGAEQDRAVPVTASRQLAQEIPGSKLCIIADAGHMANLEATEPFNGCLISFLKDLRW
jgi:pimeloyl-ACP methyl ester carboxylesterase